MANFIAKPQLRHGAGLALIKPGLKGLALNGDDCYANTLCTLYIQSPKRNGLSIPTFDKLAKLRSYYAEEVRHQTGKVASSERRFTQIHSEEGPVLEKSGNLDVWEGPMHSAVDGLDGNADDDEPMSGVEVVFRDVERTLEEEKSNGSLTAAGLSLCSLMKGELYDFKLVKAALDCIVPQEVVDMVDVVKAPSNGDWSIEDML
ncbi:hypothetical protein DFH05DRAFT_1460190 [Lentinula detonsa]|uniref:Uncharacterized protein n=1 Tax=Lentinula detonsa TaxID=2804962 RepID=A0A9W8NZK7_9AGAR|nr:hypothetical protein DFH05DRAFT_1460190 [Lentinula detonsa]